METVDRTSLKLGFGATVSAFGVGLTTLCCLPIALGGAGLGAAALGAALAPWRPWLTAAALLLLGAAFYWSYRRRGCRPGESCEPRANRWRQRVVLGATAALTLGMLTLDRWASWIIYWSL